jgi:hypothetical protein
MARIHLVTSTSVAASVAGTTVAAHTALVEAGDYQFVSTTNCWIRQGTSKLLTLVTKANMVDGETLTIVAGTSTEVYEFDVNGTGVTSGNVQVDISGATTAADIAVILRVAILANQTALTVTDPANGTLIVDLPDSRSLTITDAVAHASFTVGTGIMQATAGSGSAYIPANVPHLLRGAGGGQLGVIQATGAGTSSTTRVMIS